MRLCVPIHCPNNPPGWQYNKRTNDSLGKFALFAAHAQFRKLATIGFLGFVSAAAGREWSASFEQRLRELGWIDGQTVTIEYRWAEGREARFEEFATEFQSCSLRPAIQSVPD